MIEVEVGLVIVAAEGASVLLNRINGVFAIPESQLNYHTTSQNIAATLLKQYTGLNAIVNNVGWIPMFQKSVIDNPFRGYILIPYLVLLQQIVTPLKGEWLKVIDISNNVFYRDHKDILNKIMTEI
jgi:hypothetical protein